MNTCYCNLPAKRVISGKGNAYFTCAKINKQEKCKFFKWENEPIDNFTTIEEKKKRSPPAEESEKQVISKQFKPNVEEKIDFIIEELKDLKNLITMITQ
jgi:hypothetical protein